jgi:hypothetical protein
MASRQKLGVVALLKQLTPQDFENLTYDVLFLSG